METNNDTGLIDTDLQVFVCLDNELLLVVTIHLDFDAAAFG